jgi:hypothetical protein
MLVVVQQQRGYPVGEKKEWRGWRILGNHKSRQDGIAVECWDDNNKEAGCVKGEVWCTGKEGETAIGGSREGRTKVD